MYRAYPLIPGETARNSRVIDSLEIDGDRPTGDVIPDDRLVNIDTPDRVTASNMQPVRTVETPVPTYPETRVYPTVGQQTSSIVGLPSVQFRPERPLSTVQTLPQVPSRTLTSPHDRFTIPRRRPTGSLVTKNNQQEINNATVQPAHNATL